MGVSCIEYASFGIPCAKKHSRTPDWSRKVANNKEPDTPVAGLPTGEEQPESMENDFADIVVDLKWLHAKSREYRPLSIAHSR